MSTYHERGFKLEEDLILAVRGRPKGLPKTGELTIAGLLGHSVAGVTARYAHVPDAALIAAADNISAKISLALNGLSEQAGIVVPLHRIA